MNRMFDEIKNRLRLLSALFIVLVAILVVNSAYIFHTVKAVEVQRALVEQTQRVRYSLENLFSALKDVEASARGYLLTRDDRFLTAVDGAIAHAKLSLVQVKRLTKDHAEQRADVVRLEDLAEERIRILSGFLETVRAGKKLTDENYSESRLAMESVRRLTDTMEVREQDSLRAANDEAIRRERHLFVTVFASGALNLGLLLLIFAVIRRSMVTADADAKARARENELKEAEAEAALIGSGEKALAEMAQAILDFVTKKTNAPAGTFYTQEGGWLEACATTVGWRKSEDGQPKVAPGYRVGEALVGQAARAEGLTVIGEVPVDYFHVESSLGSSMPKYLVLCPVRFRGEIVGVIELGLFERPSKFIEELLLRSVELLGPGIASTQSRKRLEDLLEETQRQAKELQMQQEELRTTNEELETQAKALQQSQDRLQAQAEEMSSQARTLEEQQEALSIRNSALEDSRTSLQEKARELERASRHKSDFLAKMSHELRTPLNSLMILATMLQENKQRNLTDQQVEFAKTIRDAGGDLLNLINDILDLSKLEARKLEARPVAINIKPFLDQMALQFRPLAETKEIGFAVEIDDDVPRDFQSDPLRVQQILRNLLSNAFKFTSEGSVKLQVARSKTTKEHLRFSVRDTGIGVPEEKKRLIWDAFEQADGSVSRRYGGTGLGLTISRELAQLLHGQVTLESEVGEGSIFSLEIPIRFPESTSHVSSEADAKADLDFSGESGESRRMSLIDSNSYGIIAQKRSNEDDLAVEEGVKDAVAKALARAENGERTILIVEDDERFRRSVVEATSSHGFFALEAGDARTALEFIRQRQPDAILLDIKLPDMSGMALLEQIKKMPTMRHVPIHMISALEYQHTALRLGAVGYLGKPVTIEGVRGALGRIESFLERKVKRLLVVEDDAKQRQAISELVSGEDTEIVGVSTGSEALRTLEGPGADCVILDLSLPDMSGFELLERLGDHTSLSMPPVIIYTGKDITPEETDRLRRYSDSIIIKGAKSPERLLDEVSLFLHRMESDLPEDKQAMLADVRSRESAFDGRQVLLVDDDLRNLFALTSALEAKGFKVTVARNGLEALEKLESSPKTDVVLMDIMMPKMDGFEAMRHIRENSAYKTLPIIALTAKAMKGEHERCIEAGASDYLPKPIDFATLLSVLKVWLGPRGVVT